MVFATATTASAAKDVTFQVSICSGSSHLLPVCGRQEKNRWQEEETTEWAEKKKSEVKRKRLWWVSEKKKVKKRNVWEVACLQLVLLKFNLVCSPIFLLCLCRLKRSDLTIYWCKSSQLSKLVPMSHRTRNARLPVVCLLFFSHLTSQWHDCFTLTA